MVKHTIINISNRTLPVNGINVKAGEIGDIEMTHRLQWLIKNKFFEDLGEVTPKELVNEKNEGVSFYTLNKEDSKIEKSEDKKLKKKARRRKEKSIKKNGGYD